MGSYSVLKTNFSPMLHSQDEFSLPRLSSSLHSMKWKLNAVASAQDHNEDEDKKNTGAMSSSQQKQEKLKVKSALKFCGENPSTPILDTINCTKHMKNLSIEELEMLADEVREEEIYVVSNTGGHLGASLEVAELTVALHHVFSTPDDKIIWDVGHQAHPHKILTARTSRMRTIRQTNRLSGFPKWDESVHDAFGAGLGMAAGRDLLGKNNHVIVVISDGATTTGQAYEALNNVSFLDSNLIIILNDNNQVSLPIATADDSPPHVGALRKALKRLRQAPKAITERVGGQAHEIVAKVDLYPRGMMINGLGACFFEELGLHYIGPVDGHNLEELVHILKVVKAIPGKGTVLIHVVTEKGKGYASAEAAPDKMHGVVKFKPNSGKQLKPKSSTLSYTQYFAESLIAEAERDDKIVAIHAGMEEGTRFNLFHKCFPDRCFDVEIAEQDVVTFAAGLATKGLKPFCTIYSSFLRRVYYQLLHDVDLPKLPVRFAIDSAGVVGADGLTHCNAFDTTLLACLPNMVVMEPSCERELMNMVATAATIDDRSSCFRYPRGNGIGSIIPSFNKRTPLEVGKGRVLEEGTRVAILGYGTIVQSCVAAARLLQRFGISAIVVDARFCKPLDGELIRQLAREHEVLLSVEEGSVGGFGSHVTHFLALNGLLDENLKWRAMMLPDIYIDHGTQREQLEQAGLSSKHIATTILTLIGENKDVI